MVINACEICTCCSVCFRSSSICSSCCLALASCSFLCSSSYLLANGILTLIWAFSFKNSTTSPPLLRLFLALPPADSFDLFSRPCVPWLSFWFLQLPLYHLTFSCLWRKSYLLSHITLLWAHPFRITHNQCHWLVALTRCMRLNLAWSRFHRSLTPLFSFIINFGLSSLFNLSWIDSQILPWSGLPFLNWNNSLAIISRNRRMSWSSVHSITGCFFGSHLHARG